MFKKSLALFLCLALMLGSLVAVAETTYTGEADGFSDKTPIKVTVTVADGKITAVVIDEHGESESMIEAVATALEAVPAAIVEKNEAEVDIVAGATWTSKGIMAAVKAALAQTATEETAAEAPEEPAAEEAAPAEPGALINGTFSGEADGFSDNTPIKVTVTVADGKITAVVIDEHGESESMIEAVATALEAVPAAIVEKNEVEVDVVAGATWTSKGIMAAAKAALEAAGVKGPEAEETVSEPAAIAGSGLTVGLGIDSMGRLGPGKDDKDVQVYSFNQVFAGVLFDAEGRIVYAKLDQLEVASPNYDGEGMPHFAGFPGQLPYLYDENHDGAIDGVLETNDEFFQSELAAWQTKRERGEGYKMGVGTWASQMDAYEAFFVGKTIEEIEELFGRVFSSRNGRPLKDGSTNEEDKAKYDALSDEDKALL
ncbi:MAG: FMN-binding protein, partial [Christensenellales bacterium]